MIEYIGADNLVFGSDYPHMDHQPKVVKTVLEMEAQLSQETVHNIAWANPYHFYNLV
ncbi:amidohydrolase family protein [Cylindrospermum sp. FACHB-282]|uniref:amidohydrolase family protein n=1 Tax=Cylindrospermum sp. FACHB-282 TaxID=2692794 RepID=UPI002815C101|nr:amidohydrolase family protein [Cylindrospermum sp. FACHB-282]